MPDAGRGRPTVSAPNLGVATALVQHRDRALDGLLGPLVRPGWTVLTLMGFAIGLALLILVMLVLVGRRPDPRVAASADRLKARITG